jgi:hypothetical protein
MKMFLLLAVSIFPLAACNKTTEPTAADLRIARQAIAVNEVLLMLRGGYKEPQILDEVRTRHIPARIDAATEEKFTNSGAGPTLIAALKNKANVLTDVQRTAFEQNQAEKTTAYAQAGQMRQSEAFARQREEQQELNRRRNLQQQNLQNISQNQQKQTSYEIAQRNYESQRKLLEQRIALQEVQINRLRKSGYNEAELKVANSQLDDCNKQLRDLTPPLRQF